MQVSTGHECRKQKFNSGLQVLAIKCNFYTTKSTIMNTTELISQWYDEVWNKGNESFIDEMMHKNVIVHGLDPAGTSKGIQHFKNFYHNFRASFPNVKVTV